MKSIRIGGLAAALALVAVALFGVASASAAETTLCKSGTITPYCESKDQYAANTAITASTEELYIENSIIDVECASTISAETTAQTGEPLPVKLNSWALTGCKDEFGNKCTAEVKNLPFTGSLSRTTSWDGSLGFGQGGEGAPRLYAKCGVFLQCEWAPPAIEFKGGNPNPELRLSEAALQKKGGALCPSNAHPVGSTHAITSPTSAFVARPGGLPAKTTSMCKGFEEYCEPGNLYPKGTELKGTSTDFTFISGEKYGLGDYECKSASIAAQSGAEYGEPLSLSTTEFLPTGCEFEGLQGQPCTTTAVAGYNGSVSRYNADGRWSGGEASWNISCTQWVSCTYATQKSPLVIIEHGNPGTIRFNATAMKVTGNLLCPISAKLSATFPLSAPSGPLFFSDVLR